MKGSKKKIIGTVAFLLVAAGSLFFYPSKEYSMKLVHNKTGFVVMEYKEGKIAFKDRFLEKEMKLRGIAIPPPLREKFGGKSKVRLEDKDFHTAFKEVYCKFILNPSDYHWENRP